MVSPLPRVSLLLSVSSDAIVAANWEVAKEMSVANKEHRAYKFSTPAEDLEIGRYVS